MTTWIVALITMLFPIVSHVAILLGIPLIAVFYFAIVLLILVNDMFLKQHVYLALFLNVAIIILLLFALRFDNVVILYFPPIAVSSLLFWLFSRTLLSGRTPLITALALKIYPRRLTDEIRHYTLNCTRLWAIITGLMVIETILLALFAPIEVWSLFCNILNYIFLGFCLVAEYIYRVIRFGRAMSLSSYFIKLYKVNWVQFFRGQT